MKKEKIFDYLLMFLFIMALVCGVSGFLIANETFNNGLFYTLTMFAMNFTDEPLNNLINIARYAAAVFTIGAFLNIFSRAFVVLSAWLKAKKSESTFIYGESSAAELLADSLKEKAIRSKEFVDAKKVVLLDKESDNLAFYYEHAEKLKNKEVYVLSSSFANMSFEGGRHRFFSAEELFAGDYWKDYSLFNKAFDENGKAKEKLIVVFPAFNKLVEELLYQATQHNVFDVNQVVEYHVFGNHKEFGRLHKHLEELHIILHDELWSESLDILKAADRIIMPAGKKQLVNAKQLVEEVRFGTIHILTDFDFDEKILLNTRSGRINIAYDKAVAKGETAPKDMDLDIIYWQEKVYKAEKLFDNKRVVAAQMFNKNYCDLYSPTPEGQTKKQAQQIAEELWEPLDSFTRYSNLAAVDYNYTRKLILEKWGLGADVKSDALTAEQIELLAEMEHIRWCFYHFYNNWDTWETEDFADPLKDVSKRLHKDLVSFAQFVEKGAETEIEKDRAQVKFLLDRAGKDM